MTSQSLWLFLAVLTVSRIDSWLTVHHDFLDSWLTAHHDSIDSWLTAHLDFLDPWLTAHLDFLDYWLTAHHVFSDSWLTAHHDFLDSWLTAHLDFLDYWLTARTVVDYHAFQAKACKHNTLNQCCFKVSHVSSNIGSTSHDCRKIMFCVCGWVSCLIASVSCTAFSCVLFGCFVTTSGPSMVLYPLIQPKTELRRWFANLVMWQADPLFDWSGVKFKIWSQVAWLTLPDHW